MSTQLGEVNQLLAELRSGSEAARNALVTLLYADLRMLARRHLAGSRWLDWMTTTQLVHECYLRLATSSAPSPVRDRAHFMNLSSRIMRQLIVDSARKALVERTFFHAQACLSEASCERAIAETEQLLSLDRALETLAAHNLQRVRIVECRFFGGLTEAETAAALDMPLRSVQREWAAARQWLIRHMTRADDVAL